MVSWADISQESRKETPGREGTAFTEVGKKEETTPGFAFLVIFYFWPYCLVPFGDFFFLLLKQIQAN